MKILIVGLGSVGVRHLENLKHLGVRQIGVFRSTKKTIHKKINLDGIPIFETYKEALSERFDAVVICTPNALHLKYAIAAAEKGCHLYIEKPLSHSLRGVNALLQCVQSGSLICAIGCQFRFHPNLETIRLWIGDNAIGRILHVCVDTGQFLPSWHPWENYRDSYAARKDLGGGVVLTLIHEIDYLYWLFGPIRPISVVGGISGKLMLDVEDHATAFLTMSEGAPVVVHLDYLQQPPCRKMKIIGTNGTIHWDYHQKRACEYVEGALSRSSQLPPTWERNNMFMASMQDFLECVVSGKTPKAPLEDGIETLRTAISITHQMRRSGPSR